MAFAIEIFFISLMWLVIIVGLFLWLAVGDPDASLAIKIWHIPNSVIDQLGSLGLLVFGALLLVKLPIIALRIWLTVFFTIETSGGATKTRRLNEEYKLAIYFDLILIGIAIVVGILLHTLHYSWFIQHRDTVPRYYADFFVDNILQYEFGLTGFYPVDGSIALIWIIYPTIHALWGLRRMG